MVKVLLHGSNGRMGHMVSGIAEKDQRIEIVAGVDAFGKPYGGYPVYESLAQVKEEADVVIDFSTAAAVDGLLDYCAERKLPVVLCTTGLSQEQTAHMLAASEKTAVLKSANMSLGVNMLLALLKQAAAPLAAAGFDIEIVEKHHRMKLDAPSGTALALADAANSALDHEYEYVYDRSDRRMQRPVKEIGISAVRGGTIVGDHDVIFAGEDEVITFSHRAYSRAVFAKGAAEAAVFLSGKEAGMYSMGDVLGLDA